MTKLMVMSAMQNKKIENENILKNNIIAHLFGIHNMQYCFSETGQN